MEDNTPQVDLRTAVADDTAHGARLDRWMAALWPDLSRSRCKALVEAGRLSLDDAVLRDPSAKVRAGGRYSLALPPPEPATPKPEAMSLDVQYEDADLIVLNKPAGLAVHPAAGHWTGTLVHGLLHHCAGQLSGIGGVERPGIVHRLDKDTSGVMVVAKTDPAHQSLTRQFADRSIARAYIACCRGAPNPRAGRVDAALARSSADRKKMAVSQSEAAKPAITNYETLTVYGQIPGAAIGRPAASQVECRLETGRTHQIRVHMAHIGCPLIGDPVYGKGRRVKAEGDAEPIAEFRRQALHARLLGFDHPRTGQRLTFTADPPKDMQRLIKFLEALDRRSQTG
ncbi:MAG: RluA family pseudouridine synthase [Maricaulaceae bacterium]